MGCCRGPGVGSFLTIAALLLPLVTAHPSYWVQLHQPSGQCTAHPTQAFGNHRSPISDNSVTFTTTQNSVAKASLCPGQTYSVAVNFPSAGGNAWLLSSSIGTLTVSGAGKCQPSCSNCLYSDGNTKTVTASLALACSASGSVNLKVTGATNEFAAYQQNSVTLAIDSTCGCAPPPAASSPPPAGGSTSQPPPASTGTVAAPPPITTGGSGASSPPPASTTPTPTTSSSPPPSQGAGVSAAPPPPAQVMPFMVGNAYSGCGQSSLGYSCARKIGEKTLHYTIGGSFPPPNLCTGPGNVSYWQGGFEAGSGLGLGVGPASGGWPLVHWAVEAPVQGWVGLAWADSPGRMVPSNAVLGGVSATGRPYLYTTYFSDYDWEAPDSVVNSWALAGGAAQTATGTIICFSTAAKLPMMTQGSSSSGNINNDNLNRGSDDNNNRQGGGSNSGSGNGGYNGKRRSLQEFTSGILDMSGDMYINWAAHSTDALLQHDTEVGGAVVNFGSGTFDTIDVNTKDLAIVHGILMTLAFILFLPTGILLARHRTLYVTRQMLGKALWFRLHVACQFLGTALFIAGVTIALVRLPNNNYPSSYEMLGRAHYVIGIIVIGLMGVQVILAFAARPAPDAPLRKAWNLGHHNWGRLTSALAIANVFMGVVLFTHVWVPPDQQSANFVKWLVPICVVLGVQLLVEVVCQLIGHGIICKCCVAPTPAPGKSTSFGDHHSESNGVEVTVVPSGNGAAGVPAKAGVAPVGMAPQDGTSQWHQT